MPVHPPPDPPIEISVVVICFNQQDTIAAAVQSVLTQTAEKSIREIFVVDDCSTDASRAVADALAARHPKLTVIARARNSGGCAAPRNDGMRRARGTHVAFLDGDDIWMPGKLATQIAALKAVPGIGLLCSDYVAFDAATGRETRRTCTRYHATDRDQLRRFFIRGGPILPSCAVLSRAAMERAGEFDEDMPFNEDAEYWLRVAAVAPIHHQAVALVRKREWYGSLGSPKYALENLACKREITRRMLRRVPTLAEVAARREARIDYKTAVHHFGNGDGPAGRAHLRRSITLDPTFAKARLALALSYLAANPTAALRRMAHSWRRRRDWMT